MENKGLDMLLHFNKVEALGRIYLEAIEHGIPLVGFNAGGINELASMMGLELMMVDGDKATWTEDMTQKVMSMCEMWNEPSFCKAKEALVNQLSAQHYTSQIEALLNI